MPFRSDRVIIARRRMESNSYPCGSAFTPVKVSITAFIAALQAVAPMDATIPHPRVSGVICTSVSCAPTEIRNAVTKVVAELIR